jgi:sec-independent protein translocase protein TatB
MFDIGWQELFIVAVLTLIVVGPKDLPRVLRMVMGLIRKGRAMAGEFQSGIDDMVREADLDDLKKNLEKAGDFDIDKEIKDQLDPDGDVSSGIDMTEVQADLERSARNEPLAETPKAETPEAETPEPEVVVTEASPAPPHSLGDRTAADEEEAEPSKQAGG